MHCGTLIPQASMKIAVRREGWENKLKRIIVKKNRYVDSVTLMSVGDKILKMEGMENAEVQMGTWANQKLLTEIGYEIPINTGPEDLIMAVTGDSCAHLDAAMVKIEDILDHRLKKERECYTDLAEIPPQETPFNLVQISLPGEYVFPEAVKALENGYHLFIFSDNVSLEEERRLKEMGKEKGLLVMGPDCGVGYVGGVCLGAGSIMKEGPVVIVAASGSGAQEVACLLEQCGLGISALIGTGGRDLYPEIGGLEMLQAIEMLRKDEASKLIVLVSKLADKEVMKKVLEVSDCVDKPVVAVFLGSDAELFEGHKAIPAFSLEEAAFEAAKILQPDGTFPPRFSEEEIQKLVQRELRLYSPEQKYFRGLYCGGTFTEEGLLYYNKIPGIILYSNLDTVYARKLTDFHISKGHTILDMGAEDFTRESPHPVFDPTPRIRRLKQELQDTETAVVLLDFITGPGVAEDPITPFIYAISDQNITRHITYIANICGSLQDPQDIAGKKKRLEEAGVIVTSCSYESARLAGALMKELEESRNEKMESD